MVVCATLWPVADYSGARQSVLVLVALLVCLIPTTIGALLSAIGIAGMDRLVRRNVLAMSGRAVEAAGDVDVLLLDKTGTITLGNRHATELLPLDGVSPEELAEAALLSSLADETPEGRSIVELVRGPGGLDELDQRGATLVGSRATTRMSGLDLADRSIRKGAGSAVQKWVHSHRDAGDQPRRPRSSTSSWSGSASRAVRRWSWPSSAGGSRPGCSASSTSRTSSSRACASGSTRCAPWASAR